MADVTRGKMSVDPSRSVKLLNLSKNEWALLSIHLIAIEDKDKATLGPKQKTYTNN